MRALSIRSKVILVVMLFLLLSGGALIRLVYRHAVRLTGEASLTTAAQVFDDLERADALRLGMTIEAVAHVERFQQAFQARDRERLYAEAAPLFETLRREYGVTHWYFHDPEGVCFLRVHARDLHGDRIERVTLRQAMATGEAAYGKELGATAFALRVVHPYRAGERVIGYLELGQEIDGYLKQMKEMTRDEYALVVEKTNLDEKTWAATRNGARNGWSDDARLLVIDSTGERVRPELGWTAASLPAGGRVLEPVEEGGRAYLRGLFPVRDAAGKAVGGLVVFHDTTKVQHGLLTGRLGAVLAGLTLLVVLLAALVGVMNRLIFARLERMMTKLEEVSIRLAGGDYAVGGELTPSSGDEIGKFEAFFGKFLLMVGAALRDAEERSRKPSPRPSPRTGS